MSARRSFPTLISASLMVVYSSGTGLVPKGGRRQRKDLFPTILIHVAAIYEFAWMRRYASSRSVFPITMRFKGHLMGMATIIWSILRRQNPYKHGWRVSFITLLFTDSPEGPGKDQLCVTCLWYRVLLFRLLRIIMLPQAGRIPRF